MKRFFVLTIVFVCLFALTACRDREWPTRNITIVVSAGAGGGTDLGNRTLGAAMEEFLGTGINVVNNTGGGGGAAAEQVFSARHDGYMWLGFFEGIFSNAVLGTHHGNSEHWDYFIHSVLSFVTASKSKQYAAAVSKSLSIYIKIMIAGTSITLKTVSLLAKFILYTTFFKLLLKS